MPVISRITVGQVYGFTTVVERLIGADGRFAGWKCRCQCDREHVVHHGGNLLSGRTKSCGCYRGHVTRLRPDPRQNTGEKFWDRVVVGSPEECWPWTGFKERNGYGRFRWRHQHTGAHRVAYELTHGDIPAGIRICHRCDNPPCCNPDHLFAGTDADNMRDKVLKGRAAKGERNRQAFMTEKRVRAIRFLYSSGAFDQYDLAEIFGITRTNVGYIVNRKTWKHVE